MAILEEVSGVGEVFLKDTLIREEVSYDLTVVQDEIPTRRDTTIPGMKDVHGSIDLTEAESHLYFGKTLTFHLEDDRWFDFFVQSTAGNIEAAGGGLRERR